MNPTSLAVLTLAFALLTASKTPQAPDPQHKRWAEATHKFESAPLDRSAAVDAADAVKQIEDAHDFHVVLCQNIFDELRSSTYKYHTEILRLYMLGAAAYQIESNKVDAEATNLYALHSVLKGYSAILRQEPGATDKRLDDFADLDANGQLPHLIERRGCM